MFSLTANFLSPWRPYSSSFTNNKYCNTVFVIRICIGLVMLGQARGQPRPGQPRPGTTEIIKKRREECRLHWPGRPGNGWQSWQCGQSEPGEIHPSLPFPPPSAGSGQSPPSGLPPPHHDQPPSPILNPQPTQIQLASPTMPPSRANFGGNFIQANQTVKVKRILSENT